MVYTFFFTLHLLCSESKKLTVCQLNRRRMSFYILLLPFIHRSKISEYLDKDERKFILGITATISENAFGVKLRLWLLSCKTLFKRLLSL
jgi:hypothetical protein